MKSSKRFLTPANPYQFSIFMKSLLYFFLFALLSAIEPLGAHAQSTLHLIISSDNQNEDIRAGCQKDFEKTADFFKSMANEAHMAFNLHTLQFNKGEIYAFFEGFQCQADDAVVFLYTGHGFRKEDDKVIWPLMYYCLNHNPASSGSAALANCGVPLDWVHQAIIGKKPRMSITLGNSCNIQPGQEEGKEHHGELVDKEDADENNATTAHNLELLTRYQGHILVSGASPGQFAYTNDEDGSYFINALVSVLGDGLTNDQFVSTWASMLKKVRDQVQKEKPDQRPQYLIVQNQKKMYSEGKEKYQDKASFEALNLAVPETGAEEYNNWDLESFDSDDYALAWEKAFEKEFMMELALEDLPTILLYALYIDDQNIGENEYQKAYQFYQNLIDSYDLAIDEGEDLFRESSEHAAEDMSDPELRAILTEAFKHDLESKARTNILATLPKMANNPDSAPFKAFLKELQ